MHRKRRVMHDGTGWGLSEDLCMCALMMVVHQRRDSGATSPTGVLGSSPEAVADHGALTMVKRDQQARELLALQDHVRAAMPRGSKKIRRSKTI